ncbi:MAG: hypothetical protein JXA77_10620 [Bacteroidales bacterium]|nr:hypothetical protein [Bacteroidales bacterium]MBN2820528.1 hypothetical protein [Bacteroidales bacterium]
MENSFSKAGKRIIDWIDNYFSTVEKFPVKPNLNPGDIEKLFDYAPPLKGVNYDEILHDFEKKIIPGITHWQHPGFHAYFPANNSEPSVLAETLMAGLGVQGMKWITSPAATELEKLVMRWLQQMLKLPADFKGVLMDTASVSTLCAVLSARERVSDYTINKDGFMDKKLRVYCSAEAHSSVEKAVRIAGIGSDNLVKIEVDDLLKMNTSDLKIKIDNDIENGYLPCCVVGALGTTGSGAVDPLEEIGKICLENNIWFHIDAAYSGNALVLADFRDSVKGIELATSFVFNPHKWMFTNFDASAFFVKDSSLLTKTFSLVPPYLQTGHEDEIDFSNWGIQLGRRFRALKLWYVIRTFGVDGIKEKIGKHIELGKRFEKYISDSPDFEIITPRNLNIICFRYKSTGSKDKNAVNEKLLESINNSGKIFLSHTMIRGNFVLRFVCGQTNVEEKHIDNAWNIIRQHAQELK